MGGNIVVLFVVWAGGVFCATMCVFSEFVCFKMQ